MFNYVSSWPGRNFLHPFGSLCFPIGWRKVPLGLVGPINFWIVRGFLGLYINVIYVKTCFFVKSNLDVM